MQGKPTSRFVADVTVYFGAHIIGQRENCEEFAWFPSVARKRMGAAMQLVSHIYFDASDILRRKPIFRFVTDVVVYFGAHIIDQRGNCEEFACVPSVALKRMGAAMQFVSHFHLSALVGAGRKSWRSR